jgi:hypothetical protein
VLSPPFAIRFGHAALAAHWVLLAGVTAAVQPFGPVLSAASYARWRHGAPLALR